MTLVASSTQPARRLAIQTAQGEPVAAGGVVRLRCIDPRDTFQCHAPEQRIAFGDLVSLDHCLPGAHYELWFAHGEHPTVAVAPNARTVRLAATKP